MYRVWQGDGRGFRTGLRSSLPSELLQMHGEQPRFGIVVMVSSVFRTATPSSHPSSSPSMALMVNNIRYANVTTSGDSTSSAPSVDRHSGGVISLRAVRGQV